jgi:transcriptional/translational regulatory protein YebC/TACO1
MAAPKQITKLKQHFESAAYEGVSRAETGNARLLHVNEVISWVRDVAVSSSYLDNAAAIAAGLKTGDIYHTVHYLTRVIIINF